MGTYKYAQNFGQAFIEWQKMKDVLIAKASSKVESVLKKWTKNIDIQSDMHNLFPAIGAVNATRSNYNLQYAFWEVRFGSCDMRIDNQKAQPPVSARGQREHTCIWKKHIQNIVWVECILASSCGVSIGISRVGLRFLHVYSNLTITMIIAFKAANSWDQRIHLSIFSKAA